MPTRLLLLTILSIACGCADELAIGSAHIPDAGADAQSGAGAGQDEMLARYARALGGQWKATLPTSGSAPMFFFVLTFEPSLTRARTGTFALECRGECSDESPLSEGEYWLYSMENGIASGIAEIARPFGGDVPFRVGQTFTFDPNKPLVDWFLNFVPFDDKGTPLPPGMPPRAP